MAATYRTNEGPITIGSGTAYIAEFTGTVPTHATLCVDTNKLGDIKGGATVSYTSESYTAESDNGKNKKTIITKEGATVGLGIIGWVGSTLKKLCSTGRVTEASGIRTVKIGGIDNNDGKRYVLCIHHEDAQDGDVWVTIVGKNTAGFELAFKPDAETAVNPTFTAEPSDDDGTLIIYEEEITTSGSGGSVG